MSGLRIGSLCSGYGGLDMAVQAVFGGSLAWVADNDAGACRILAHRHPQVPNLGDITSARWDEVEPVDVVTGGYPCRSVPPARGRESLMSGTSGPTSPVPLGFYDPVSRCLRTSQGTFLSDSTPCLETLPPSGSMRGGALFAHLTWERLTSANASLSSPGLPTPAARDWRGGGQRGQLPTAVTSLLPTPSTSENTGAGHAAQGGMNLRHVVSLLPTPRASENENRQTRRSPSQEAGTHGKSLAAEMGSLLPTPRATDGSNGAVSRTEATDRRVQSGTANLPEVAVSAFPVPSGGVSTPKRSRGGRRSSSAPPPGQLTLWDG